jgi:hypothetical protein
MAIKGKSKGRAARAVTRGPKPAYVPVKKPLLARRGFWIAIASVLGVLVIAGLWYGFARERSQTRERELEEARAEAFETYGRQIEPIIGSVGEPVDPASWSSFTELSEAIDTLEAGEGQPGEVAATGSGSASTARNAWGALENVDALAAVRGRGLDQLFVAYVLGSRESLIASLKLYEQAGELVAMAAEAPEGTERDALIQRARGVIEVARSTFESGFSDYVEASTLAGLFEAASTGNLQTQPLPLPTGPTGG